MRTREEQIEAAAEFIEADEGYTNMMNWMRSQIEEAEQRVRAEISKRDTWFYMVGDPESGHADMADMLCEKKPFEIVETSEAADIRIFFAYQDEDGKIHEFSTREEAELAANKAIDAAREVE